MFFYRFLLFEFHLFVTVCVLHVYSIQYQVTEETGTNFFVGDILKDANIAVDINDTSSVEFSLLSARNNADRNFYINSKNGSIFTNVSLDREKLCPFEDNCFLAIEVVAKSPASEFFKIIKIDVEVLDVNDHVPVFPQTTVRLDIAENVAVGTTWSLDGAVDDDATPLGVQRYEIATGNTPFEAEADTYPDGRSMLRLVTKGNIDRETKQFYQIQIFAYDGGDPPFTGSLVVELYILDVNDNYPVFSKASYNVTIDDRSEAKTFVTKVTAYDEDYGENGQVEYRMGLLQSSEILKHFAINKTHGDLSVKSPFDSAKRDHFRIIVEAYDKAKQPLVSQSTVFVTIRDTYNDFPVININILTDSGSAEVSEHASYGSVLALVAVNDPDTGANGLVTCTVSTDSFAIQRFEDDENEYKITVATSLNREVRDTYIVTVKCSDAGSPPQISNSSFTVTVLDENDHSPVFYQSTYQVHMIENNEIGHHLIDVLAVDYDIGDNSVIKYSLPDDVQDRIYINPNNGFIYVNFTADREVAPEFVFHVYASDRGSPSLTGTATVSLIIDDANDNYPSFSSPTYAFTVQENLPPNSFIGQLKAFDMDAGKNGEISYKMYNTLNEIPVVVLQNGSIFTSQTLDREAKSAFTFKVEASDKTLQQKKSMAIVTVQVLDENDNSPYFIFPNSNNNTIIISYGRSQSTKVTTLKAKDGDTGVNARLAFFSNDRNYSDIFAINSRNGDIVLIKQLTSLDIGSYKLEVMVKDNGLPPRYHEGLLQIIVTSAPETEPQTFSKYYVIAIIISLVTVTLAALMLLLIFFIKRRERQALNESNTRQQFIDKIKEGEEAGFHTEVSVVTPKEVFYPPTCEFGSRQFHTIERAKSVQVPPTIPEDDDDFQDRILQHLGEAPIWENPEANEYERHRNQLISLQYQQSLMKIKSVKRSHSVLTL